ncbi:MAG: DJ-1/PfpI family protein [Tumebacillaceae bacterium]
MNAKPHWNVGILMFEGADMFDFAVPAEIFTVTTYNAEDALAMLKGSNDAVDKPFTVRTVSCEGGLVQGNNGMQVLCDYSFKNAPSFDIVLVPGAVGESIEQAMMNRRLLSWLKKLGGRTPLFLSVCTGSLLLAAAGLLEGKQATTNVLALDDLERIFPNVQVVRDSKYVDAGSVITSQGPATGIDIALHVVKRLLGSEVAACTAASIEYRGNHLFASQANC